jgi:hypothetical protein
MAGDDTPLTEDLRFLLGQINAVVTTLPARMDRFEIQVSTSLIDLNTRLRMVEQAVAQKTAVSSTLTWIVGLIAGAAGSLASGTVTYFLTKHG